MATITKQILSGSTSGTPISLTDTATSGNTDAGYLVHTAVAGATDFDEIWIWATNVHTAAVILTLECGSKDEDQHIKAAINPNETVLVCPGMIMNGGLVISAFASVANEINLFGFVNRLDY
tara:strand:+ start:500 stop:862 length:363 start_codon:yes stop_codon:yes gene_type:complete